MGPVQGQDLTGVLSSLALRLPRGTDVRGAFDSGDVVRGYPMRSTVFAVSARDAGWVTELCAGQQRRESARRWEKEGVVPTEVARAHDVFLDSPGLTRKALGDLWARHGFPDDTGFRYLMIRDMMLHGTAVYGPFEGTDQLIVPATQVPYAGDRSPAAELLLRYLTGHGPADLRDFAWWTKLPQRTVKEAFAEIADEVETTDGLHHRPGLYDEVAAVRRRAHGTFALPAFDEIMLGYRDRLTYLSPTHHEQVAPGNRGVFRRTVVRGGRFVATWSTAGVEPFRALSATAERDVTRAVRNYPRVL
ncbi:DNA glycosylase AlkZ-like family protein [Corynebacterium kalidii]|uniref:Winged helix DNA-binding domain-containing protein n=1 Tax=Corynebacterium kalidii TaxID=2931982 RepID=A0A9X1WES8_9CORY|nr:crosslink repair DNA glycosylase YcaQ family protein [Corynebacterium kalidii]MCJ7857664.1 winged helix DNA-binding domain-containing protein [Corynebacterium kalidii]